VVLERRKYRRFNLQVQVQFNWKDHNGVRCIGTGTTRDISTKGMYVYSDALPPPDAELRTVFSFPAPPMAEDGVEMTTKARVVRLDAAGPGKTGAGFALMSRSIALRRRNMIA
jgi:hypothetical protein